MGHVIPQLRVGREPVSLITFALPGTHFHLSYPGGEGVNFSVPASE